jgi:hypothetical protein
MIRVCSELWEKSQSGAPEPSMPLSSWTPKGQADCGTHILHPSDSVQRRRGVGATHL